MCMWKQAAGFDQGIIFYTQSNRKKFDFLNIAIWGFLADTIILSVCVCLGEALYWVRDDIILLIKKQQS